MSEEAPSGKLMRIRVYEDDAEMTAIYDRFNEVRENSRNRRGRARRGAESEWLRRIIVAGYTQLFGPFHAGAGAATRVQLPPATSSAPAPASRNPAATRKTTHVKTEIKRQDKQTNVAQMAAASNNDTAQQQGHSAASAGANGLDFNLLLGGGNSIVSSPNPTSEVP
ncbi:hypothetical protein QE400_000137 [Xanthomonas sacchari]|uniref:hypothetical protein n=1 Tax=Xanthomonas sacchari TaxID=56458 RepID=UPI002781FE9C|nr:hypothetical protein [Xanthomonas sacchari]MDQ1090724.1 hypothetical protein [Xanthomonas sacchari]